MPSFTLAIKKRGSQIKPLMVVVGKSVSKKATRRNLLKRRARAILSPFVKKTGKEAKLILRPSADKLSFKEMKLEIEKELKNYG